MVPAGMVYLRFINSLTAVILRFEFQYFCDLLQFRGVGIPRGQKVQ